jgi:hypothetical protein
VFNTETGKTVASVDIVGDTDDVFYDAASRQLFVSGGAGHVSVIAQKGADTYTVVGQVDTASGARTSFFVPGSGLLYVAVPHRGTQRAEILAFQMISSKK